MSTLSSVMVRDLIANRPAAGIAGRLFFASDTGQNQRDNGSTWDSILTTAGVSTKTADYTALAADNNTLLVMNSASTHTITLPAASPGAYWKIDIQNVGAGTLTVARNGLLIDTAASNLTLTTAQGVTIFSDGTNYFTQRGMGSGGGAGTVTSVAMTVPTEFSVSGSPIITSGTLAVTKQNQNANLAYAGPSSGGAAAPTFRSLVMADLPITFVAPYIFDGTNYFIPADHMYQATRPATSPTWLSTTGTATAGTNGNVQISAVSNNAFAALTGSASAELVATMINTGADAGAAYSHCSVWLWDSTNNFIYVFYPAYFTRTPVNDGGTVTWFSQKWTYNGTGNPTFSAGAGTGTLALGYQGYGGPMHLKISISAGTISMAISIDGGSTYFTVNTVSSIGTISKGGYEVSSNCVANIMSIKVA